MPPSHTQEKRIKKIMQIILQASKMWVCCQCRQDICKGWVHDFCTQTEGAESNEGPEAGPGVPGQF